VAEALDDAAVRGARYAEVSVVRLDERLVVTVEDDGRQRASSMEHVVDRVGAAGGTLALESGVMRAEIPCG